MVDLVSLWAGAMAGLCVGLAVGVLLGVRLQAGERRRHPRPSAAHHAPGASRPA